ncbi:MAG: aa3-type cytochrome c oxidase subunit IV [Novosphingobium sp.]
MASGNDFKAARETYGAFTGVVKWSAVAIAVIVAIVVMLIAS